MTIGKSLLYVGVGRGGRRDNYGLIKQRFTKLHKLVKTLEVSLAEFLDLYLTECVR